MAQLLKIPLSELTGQKNNSPRAQEAPVTMPRLAVTRPPNSYLILIAYRSRDPEQAAQIANAIAKEVISTIPTRFGFRLRPAFRNS